MTKVHCANINCLQRRVHYEQPDVMRGQQMIEVPDGFTGKAYCSLTCQAEGEKINVWTGKKIEPELSIDFVDFSEADKTRHYFDEQ